MISSERWAFSVKIPSDTKYIRKVSAEIEDFLKSNGVNEEAIFDIRLSIEEAVKNAIIHGNKNRKDAPVYITYSLKNGKFSAEIQDQGSGFNPGSLPDPTEGDNLYKACGRGVFLIKKLMDEARYNNNGNKIFMLKLVEGGQDAG